MNALLDKDFLKELDNYHHKEVYARITALTVNELPMEMIEGRVTGGSVNIDGASAIRRTCSLSLVAEGISINNFYWGLNNKFKLEIGLKNFINDNYPEIIWFSQGVYIITSFNTQSGSNKFNISISGKDKMCLLNGEVGGSIPMSVDFGVEEIIDGSYTTYRQIPIKEIIREMLHAYALEPYHNIVINDLEDKGLELLEYRGEEPMYLAYNVEAGIYDQMYDYGRKDTICYLQNGNTCTLETIPEYNMRVDEIIPDQATVITFDPNGTQYTVSKIEYGQTAGYCLTDLVYAGDLISNIGESITSILDKIVNMLGNFEYFYDLEGRFIFQEKKTYINTSWSPIIETDEDIYVENAVYIDSSIYSFGGNNLVSAISNNPNWNNVKNDYAIWGVRKGASGAELPIHFRYAIHKKPEYYRTFNGDVYTSSVYDWRELIYQMALDYFKHNQEDDFYIKLIQNNKDYYPTGMTGYEQFYTDMQAFWREMYFPDEEAMPKAYYEYYYGASNNKYFIPVDKYNEQITDLFVCDNYQSLNADSKVDRMKVVTLWQNKNGEYELQKLIDTIPVKYIFNDKGKQTQTPKYYITDNSELKFKEVTKSTYDRIDKKELYVYDGINWPPTPILDTITLNANCYLKTSVNANQPNSINSLPETIQPLYKYKNQFAKYYTTSKLNLEGKDTGEKIYNYFTYYLCQYDYFRQENTPSGTNLRYWNRKVKENPDQLTFWLDFLDVDESKIKVTSLTKKQYSLNENILFYEDDSFNLIPLKNKDWDYIQNLVQEGRVYKKDQKELGQYSILAIGDRPKVVNDSNVKSIYYRNVPNLIFTTDIYNDFKEKDGYEFAQIEDFNFFNISAQGKSAKNALDELLYQHSYCTESINITAIPVYYLEPNTRISVRDDQSKIDGEYIVSRITLPLTYNGQMSIQATKAPQRFN